MSYSEAIEEQLDCLRFVPTPKYFQFAMEQMMAVNVARFPDEYGRDRRGLAKLRDALDPPISAMQAASAALLEHADTYFVDGAIADVLSEVSKTMPDWTLTPEAVPSKLGFCVFGHPITLPYNTANPDIDPSNLTALGWMSMQMSHDLKAVYYPNGVIPDQQNIFVVVPFTESYARGGKGVPLTMIPWPFGIGLTANIAARTKAIENLDKQEGGMLSLDPDEVMNNTMYFLDIGQQRIAAELRVIAALFQFVAQKLLISVPTRPDRATRRRMEKAGKLPPIEPLVRVITLRKKKYVSNHSGDSEPKNWSCQWMVGGHWRQQWYPSIQLHQPKWIAAYIKGNPDKDLKVPRARVFAVVR